VPLLLCAAIFLIPVLALSSGRTHPGRVAVGLSSADAVAQPAAAPSWLESSLAPISTTDAVVVAASVADSPVAAPTPATPMTSAAVAAHVIRSITRPPVKKASVTTTAPKPVKKPRPTQSGPASWYGAAKGTCAHQTLPFGTVVSILDTDNGRTATCTVDDRGPYQDGRIIDLSPDVFSQLAPTSTGVINVQISW
jgi:rare lipoprotein A (peptidoglycan hydrolase)